MPALYDVYKNHTLPNDVDLINMMVCLVQLMIPPTTNVVDVLAGQPQYSTFVKLLKISGLADALQEFGPFTVFAPTDKVTCRSTLSYVDILQSFSDASLLLQSCDR